MRDGKEMEGKRTTVFDEVRGSALMTWAGKKNVPRP